MAALAWSEIVETTAEPAFVVSANGRVLAWNRALTEWLGHPQAVVHGRSCYTLLDARDEQGGGVCDICCPIRRFLREGGTFTGSTTMVRDVRGKRHRARMTILAMRHDGEARPSAFLHLLMPLASESRRSPAAIRADPLTRWTAREHEVLHLIEEGKGATAIARQLGVAESTALRYSRSVLRKLREAPPQAAAGACRPELRLARRAGAGASKGRASRSRRSSKPRARG